MNDKILVTGSSGYLARALLDRLASLDTGIELVGLDCRPPPQPTPGVRFHQVDMLEPEWREVFEEERPTVVVHSAFVVNPMHDEKLMERINVEGTRATLAATKAVGAKQLICLSSATAYGAFADNPVPLTEAHPTRGDETFFRYAIDKGILERDYESFRHETPGCKVAVVRPVIVYGPNVDNYLSRFVFAFPLVPLLAGGKTPMQFVHEEDVAEVLIRIIERRAEGVFNVAGEGYVTLAEICQMAKRPAVALPRFLVEVLVATLWKLQLRRAETPPSALDFIQYPWVVDTDRMQRELDFTPKFTSREAVEAMIDRNRVRS